MLRAPCRSGQKNILMKCPIQVPPLCLLDALPSTSFLEQATLGLALPRIICRYGTEKIFLISRTPTHILDIQQHEMYITPKNVSRMNKTHSILTRVRIKKYQEKYTRNAHYCRFAYQWRAKKATSGVDVVRHLHLLLVVCHLTPLVTQLSVA